MIKLGLPLKLAAIFFFLSSLGIAFVTYISFLGASSLLEKQSLQSVSDALQRESNFLESEMKTLRRDAIFLSANPSLYGVIGSINNEGYAEQEHLSASSWKNKLATVFRTMTELHPAYILKSV